MNILNRSHLYFIQLSEKLYTDGEYGQCFKIMNSVMNSINDVIVSECKLNKNIFENLDVIRLVLVYSNACSGINEQNKYVNYLDMLHEYLNKKKLTCNENLKIYILCQLALTYLSLNKYKKAHYYLPYLHITNGPNVSPENVCFLKSSDTNKIQLIYTAGGLGDIIMFARFVQTLCMKYSKNKIVFAIEDVLVWIYNNLLKSFSNVITIKISKIHTLKHFDYHCSDVCLMRYMNYNESNIPYNPILTNLYDNKDYNYDKIVGENEKKKIVINWMGRKHTDQVGCGRDIPLIMLEKIFALKNISWFVVTKNMKEEDIKILEKNKVTILDNFDKGENAFENTIPLFKLMDYVISTDTSIVHVAGNLNINTIVLLSLNHDWRWNNNKWYPNIKKIIQKESNDWGSVISELTKLLEAL